MKRRPPSLVFRLLLAQIIPLAILASALAAGGALVADRVVERTSDRLLAGSVTAILQQVSATGGQATVVLSPWSLGLLDGPERDAVFYSVHQGGRLVTGYGDLATANPPPANALAFRDGRMRGMPVRIAESTVEVPGVEEPVVVAVAQTLDSRRASTRELLSGLIALPVFLVLAAALLIWPATLWGLRPLRRLVRRLTDQSTSRRADFTPASLERVPAELAPVVTAYNGLLAHLEDSASALERFAADASHQLRTPLSVITANLALLAAPGRRRPEHAVLIQDSRDASARLNLVLKQLLALARAETATSSRPVDLNRVASDVAEAATRAFPHAAVQVRLSSRPRYCLGDATLIGEMLTNLVNNAILYGGGRVFLVVAADAVDPCVIIWDHGSGVPEVDLPRLTDRFYRGAKTQDASGIGLGLAIVKSIATAFDVTLGFRNRPRGGFVVTLEFMSHEPKAAPRLSRS